MNPDITAEALGTVSVWYKGQTYPWIVDSVEPDEKNETIHYKVHSDEIHQSLEFSINRWNMGDSLSVVRGSVKSVILAEMDRRNIK